MLAPLPTLPNRSASDIHTGLAAVASVFLPEWRGREAEGEFGQALLRILARFGEHVSSRIAKTPWRDTVAFFDSLDIPVQPPRPANAPLVFLLGKKLTTPVFSPAGIQVGAAAKDGELLFETLEAIHLTPARLVCVVAVDSDADSIEFAPPGFLSLEPPNGPVPEFLTASTAPQGSTSLQIEPFEALKAGDQISIGTAVYRLGEGQDGLFPLLDALETAVAAGTPILKVTAFNAFHNRNVQEHALYIGHSELLNLEQAMEIVLEIDPPDLADSLDDDAGEWQIYASQDQAEPAWCKLERSAPREPPLPPRQISLDKKAGVKTEKTEVNGSKNFWLRYLFGDSAVAQWQDVRLTSIGISIATPPFPSNNPGSPPVTIMVAGGTNEPV